MLDRIFYSICFGFASGVFLRSFVPTLRLSSEVGIPTSSSVGIFYLAILFALISFFLILFFGIISKNKWGIIAGIFILAFSLGILRFHIADKLPSAFFESQVGKTANFSGIIIDEPDKRENNIKLTVEIKDPLRHSDTSPLVRGRKGGGETRILVSANFDEDFKYGDEINFSGKLSKPENFITDQGKNFDYINYLRKDRIFYVMSYPKIEIISNGNGNKIKSVLFSIKEKFLEKMNFAIPEPESLLMGGLILGEKSSFSQAMRQSFVDTGTIHIVALSGYNVTIVAEWIMKIFSFLPRNFSLGLGIFAIFLFVLMTGANSTAVRAGIMAVLALFARATGRNYDAARALVLAGVIMVFFNPFVLGYDVSFQLSFLAVIAVIFFAPKVEKYFMWIKWRWLRDIVAVTCAVYIFVLPFILYKMGNLSLVALPANILILPFIPLTMLFGFLTGFAGLILPTFGIPAGWVSYLLLHYELAIVGFFSHLPFAAFYISNFPLIITLLIYAYFVYRLFGSSIKKFFVL